MLAIANNERAARIQSYARGVCDAYQNVFTAPSRRFPDGSLLLSRFERAIQTTLSNANQAFTAVDEIHNEVCVAGALLADPVVVRLRYEPELLRTLKSIDLVADRQDGTLLFVDVKTIHPVPTDRWDQYERAMEEGWLGNVNYDLQKHAGGGELWHDAFASRSRMLEYTLELEQKIAEANLAPSTSQFVLALCGTGFEWGEDELEDFASFYRTGKHRSDDTFGATERKYLEEKALTLSRTITGFACLHRSRGATAPTLLSLFKTAG